MDRTLNVLVVDDEQIILDSIKRHLRKIDCELFFALSVAEGMDILAKNKIDIILTDLMMPDIDGLEFMKMAKVKYPATPMIMITGYATINTALQATQLGAFDYIAKPFSKRELLSVIEKAADIVLEIDDDTTPDNPDSNPNHTKMIPSSGDSSWMLLDENGIILLGVRDSFLKIVGDVKSVYLPSVGDIVRQGGSFLQLVSTTKKSYSILSPLSGTVVAINEEVRDNPNLAAEDPFGRGWMVRIEPSRLEDELKFLGY